MAKQAPAITPIQRALRPFQEFFATEAASGVFLLGCAVLAMAWANSPWSDSYFHLWEQTLSIGLGDAAMQKSLHHWINDGLMVVFFFLVGLEIKREFLVGELASPRQAALPIAAAIGGMLVPAALYAMVNSGGPGAPGWAIPMATDIAFALGVLALLASRVPPSLKVFLSALAIVDDLGAVVVIAVFYTSGMSVAALGAAAVVLALLIACNRLGVRHAYVYALFGILLWLAVLKSGVHATIAGVLLAMTIPSRTRINEDQFIAEARSAVDEFEQASGPQSIVMTNGRQQEALHVLESAASGVQAPLMTMQHSLHGFVAFVVMPIFAFANAGVRITGDTLAALEWRIVIGICLGLILGKFAGILGASWLSVRLGIAAPLAGAGWRSIAGVSALGGIGFTMSLFVADLAFSDASLLDSAKVGVIAGSAIAGTIGWILLRNTRSALAGGARAGASSQ